MTSAQIRSGVIIDIVVTEPWELGDRVLSGRMLAVIPAPDGTRRRGSIQLLDPVSFRGQSFEYFALEPRSESATLDELMGAPLDCNLTSIAADDAVSGGVDPSKWRGGLGIIAKLQVRPR